ncbi:MAG TPA: NADPH-dependent F420 reductase [Egibacteraceae bacterium]|nr:NADPH-dependent F420 reductase [Egibacteraceae bacterium]
MNIAFIGGTGPLGRGLGLRLALAGHDVVLGSRTAEKAQAAAADAGAPMTGADNATACEDADVVFVTVPFEGQADILPALGEVLEGKVVVSTVVPMGFDGKGPHPLTVEEGSAAEQCQALVPGARVVSGFQWVPAPKLLKPDVVVEMDVPLLADDEEPAAVVASLCSDIKALRGFYAGPLRLSSTVEGLTPLIISANKRYKAHAGVRFVGLEL